MDALGLSQADLLDNLEGLREEQQARQANQATNTPNPRIPRPLSTRPRVLQLSQRSPVIHKCCVPEVMQQCVREGGIDVDDCGQVKDHLEATFRCEAHGKQCQLQTYSSRISDWTNGSKHVVVLMGSCTHNEAPCFFCYDGNDDEVFNLSNTEMFTHTMMCQMLYHVYSSGSSFNALRETMVSMEMLLPRDQQRAVVSLPVLIDAFFDFTALLTDLPGCTCPICGQYPIALIGDGTGYKVFEKQLEGAHGFGHPTTGLAERHEVGLMCPPSICWDPITENGHAIVRGLFSMMYD